jgi:hypothetical protein
MSTSTGSRSRYAKEKERKRRYAAQRAMVGRDIAPLPPIADPARRRAALGSLRVCMETYFSHIFKLAWSPDHLYAIRKMEEAIVAGDGRRFALAMPRGNGKTMLCDVAVIWAILTGLHRFVMLFACSQKAAIRRLASIKKHLRTNRLLYADFPEVCHPIRELENIANRAKGQIFYGRATDITWKDDEIVFPTIAGSLSSGAILRVAGLDSEFRGANDTDAEGKPLRPTLAIIDDPQTDESAGSLTQCDDRERRIKGGILGLEGPEHRITVFMACTVIEPGDLAERFLDRKKNPTWSGHRTKLLNKFPKEISLWEEYWRLYADSLEHDGDGSEAIEFLCTNWTAMHAEAEAAWPERKPGCLSAVEYAMRLYFEDPYAFASEYQNDPLDDGAEEGRLTEELLGRRSNNHKRGLVPSGIKHLVAHVDLHDKAFYWSVVAWEEGFRGHVVAYGTYPDQRKPYFSLNGIRQTIARAHPRLTLEGRLYAALQTICHELLEREWPVDGGAVAKLERLGIDANWGDSTETVYRFARQSTYSASIRPMHGVYRGASSEPLVGPSRKRKRGEIAGDQWIIPPPNPIRHISFDSNYWKSRLAARLLTPLGERGSLALHAGDHRLLIDHCLAEYPVRTVARIRKVDEWKLHAGRDNHFWDNLVACCVLASTLGIDVAGPRVVSKGKHKGPRKAQSLAV